MIASMKSLPRFLLGVLLSLMLFTAFNAGAQTTRATLPAQQDAARVPPPGEDDPTTPPFNAAMPISQSVPTTMTAGSVYTVTINMKNTGNTTWSSAGSYNLGSRNPLDNWTWGGTRVPTPGDIAPDGFAQFTFQVTAPTTPGSYNFQWGMVQDGVAWFGSPSANVVVNVVAAPRNGSQFVSQSVPASMITGGQYPVSLTFANTGNTAWDPTNGKYVLLAVNPINNETWVYSRIPLSGPVAPGQQTTVAWTTRAPATPGTYNFQWIILEEGVELIGTPSTNVSVVVSAPAPVNGAQVLGFLVSPMTQGQNATVTVTLQNTGGTTWGAGSNYKLGSQNPGENLTWGVQRVDLASDVAPGQNYTFTFPIIAPAAGTYTMQWQMMQRYVEWFGGVASAPVTVNAPPSGDIVTYIHTDALGSPVARSDSAGNIVSRTQYEPYGRTAGGVTPSIGFTGHVNDADTGLVYMQQRYYDPVAGRFLSVDPVTTDANTGGTFNRYYYANGNPYKYTDPDGRFSSSDCSAMGTLYCNTYGSLEAVAATISKGFDSQVVKPVERAVETAGKWADEQLANAAARRDAHTDLLAAANAGDRAAQNQIAIDIAMGFTGSVSGKIAGGHAFEKHVLGVGARIEDPLFRGLEIRTVAQLQAHVAEVMANPTAQKALRNGRTGYYDAKTSTVVIQNPRAGDMGTAFQPINAKAYYDKLR